MCVFLDRASELKSGSGLEDATEKSLVVVGTSGGLFSSMGFDFVCKQEGCGSFNRQSADPS